MVEIFKTNVRYKLIAKAISAELLAKLPGSTISFDLEDCDKVLRIESKHINPETVVDTLKERGFICEILE